MNFSATYSSMRRRGRSEGVKSTESHSLPEDRDEQCSLADTAESDHSDLSDSQPLAGPLRPGPRVQHSGSLWKLGSGLRDPSELSSWRRRHFMVCHVKPYGEALVYVSEKENLQRHLSCILHCERSGARAKISRLKTLPVTCQDEASLQANCHAYDLAVHGRAKREGASSVLPTVLQRIAIDGIDSEGCPQRVELGSDSERAIADWHAKLEIVVQPAEEPAVDPP